jgi:muconolactone delta-isomerase
MQFLTLSRRMTGRFAPESFTPELVAGEALRVKELYATGLLRQVGKRSDTMGAAIVWEAASETEVRDAVASLPIFKAGMLELVVLVPLEPYAGFGPAK